MSRLQTNAIRHLGSTVDNLTVDNAGRVLLPNQPAFMAGRTLGDVTGGNVIVYNSVSFNIGNCYNSSTGKFTAPVTGKYFFSGAMINGTNNTYGEGNLRVNGVDRMNFRSGPAPLYNESANFAGVLYLVAGDQVEVYQQINSIYGQTAVVTYFCGHLIG